MQRKRQKKHLLYRRVKAVKHIEYVITIEGKIITDALIYIMI